jgi:hypothetical protein
MLVVANSCAHPGRNPLFCLVPGTKVTRLYYCTASAVRGFYTRIKLSIVGLLLNNPKVHAAGLAFKAVGLGIDASIPLLEIGAATVEKVVVDQQQIVSAFEMVESLTGKSKWLDQWKQRLTDPNMGRVLGYPSNMKLLEGKTFALEYEDGVGLIKVDIADQDKILTTHEKELLQRAFYLSDYYIFKDCDNPHRQLKPGNNWQVDAKTLAGVLDPRLRHRAEGKISLYREENQTFDGKDTAVFKIDEGTVKMVPVADKKSIAGEVSFSKGQIFYDLGLQYVRKADLSGAAKYRELSSDHLLFGARFFSDPNISMRYECSCQKK